MAHSVSQFLPPIVLPEPSLFDSTSIEAGRAAAKISGQRCIEILGKLKEAGSDGLCIFEIALMLGLLDHKISGRFSQLEKRLAIRKTGRRRQKPDNGKSAEVYEITIDGLAILAAASPSSEEGGAH